MLLVPHGALAFGFTDVVKQAKALAASPYVAPPSTPKFLADLGYDEFRKIRFDPKRSLWQLDHGNFQVMLVAPGLYFRHIVNIYVVNRAGVHRVPFRRDDFSWPSKAIEKRVPRNLGYAGFKLAYPLDTAKGRDQFLVFAGASYFRGVARGQNFGLYARGIAVDTGLPNGEQFPIFTDFWLVRPSSKSARMRFYALLNGPSIAGAYRFVVIPGAPTRLNVKAVLFLRKNVSLLGMAPLTSMFFYGQNTPRPPGQWRAAVHDSDGLLIHASTGEWLWHPLINPIGLEMNYFEADSPLGFGLMQRDRHFRDYEDPQALYNTRPDAWVQPHGDWGKGNVVLVEIPTDTEFNDNIVAFWAPSKSATQGSRYNLDYSVSFGRSGMTGEPLGTADQTFVGSGGKADVYRFIVDFGGGSLAKLGPTASVKAIVTGIGGAKILQQDVEWLGPLKEWRLAFLVQVPTGKILNLRAFLKSGDRTLTGTWTYELPSNNRFDTHPGRVHP
ncbi:MAG: glucan biosynthesis protein G [Gammaproteobacteria bacterium]